VKIAAPKAAVRNWEDAACVVAAFLQTISPTSDPRVYGELFKGKGRIQQFQKGVEEIPEMALLKSACEEGASVYSRVAPNAAANLQAVAGWCQERTEAIYAEMCSGSNAPEL
jgi:hypothetical protein